jgi:hypothetical protein
LKPFLSYGIFLRFNRLDADDLSRRQPIKEHMTTGVWAMNENSSSAAYYREREKAERTLSEHAASLAIRDIHLEMAKRYRELAEQLEMPARSGSLA